MIFFNEKGGIYGKLMILEGIMIIVPLVMIPFNMTDVPYIFDFLVPGLGSVILGLLICIVVKNREYTRNNLKYISAKVVFFAWLYGFFIGSLPFILSGRLTMIQALFESVSGFTTTGLSVIDVTVTPAVFLFYRSFIQFMGGLGFILMMIIFIQGKQSMDLYNAEGHPDKLMPNLGKTARTIFAMYSGFLVLGTIAYAAFGMSLFDSINHAMCALSTGGFSTKADSIGAFHSPQIEGVTIILMLIGTTNFAVLLLLVKGKIRQFFKVSEVRFMFLLLFIFVPVMSAGLFFKMYLGLGESIRLSLFNVVSALSTTGFSTCYYNDWPPFSLGIMIILMLIGGGIGSTAGGIKLTRVYIIIRMLIDNVIKKNSSDRYVNRLHYYRAYGKSIIDEATSRDAFYFAGTYLIIYITGVLALTLTTNGTLTETMFEFASSLGTVGLSVGLTGPAANPATLIIEIFGMILGRLEIFAVIMGIYAIFQQIKIKYKKWERPCH